MSEISFELPIRSPAAARSTTAWLILGLISLVAAGVFSILLGLTAIAVVAILVAGFSFGVAVILTELPIGIAVAHNWLAAMLLLSLIRLLAECRNQQALL